MSDNLNAEDFNHLIDCDARAINQWLLHGRRGASSSAIIEYLRGERRRFFAYPSDASDFGRCQGLFEACPDIFPIFLKEMPKANEYWSALVPRWQEIAAAENSSALIQEIVRPIEDADSDFLRLGPGLSMRVGE